MNRFEFLGVHFRETRSRRREEAENWGHFRPGIRLLTSAATSSKTRSKAFSPQRPSIVAADVRRRRIGAIFVRESASLRRRLRFLKHALRRFALSGQALCQQGKGGLGLFGFVQELVIAGSATEEVFGGGEVLVGGEQGSTLAGQGAGDTFRIGKGFEFRQGCFPGGEGGSEILLLLIKFSAIGRDGGNPQRFVGSLEILFGFGKGLFRFGEIALSHLPKAKLIEKQSLNGMIA